MVTAGELVTGKHRMQVSMQLGISHPPEEQLTQLMKHNTTTIKSCAMQTKSSQESPEMKSSRVEGIRYLNETVQVQAKACKEHQVHTEPSHPLVLYQPRYKANSLHRSKPSICISDERHYKLLDCPGHLQRQDSLISQSAYFFLPNNLQCFLHQKMLISSSPALRDAACTEGVKAGQSTGVRLFVVPLTVAPHYLN